MSPGQTCRLRGQVAFTRPEETVKLPRSRRRPPPTAGDRRRQPSPRGPLPEWSPRQGAMHRVIADAGVRAARLGRTPRRRSGSRRFQHEGARPEPRRGRPLGRQHAGARFDGGPTAPSVWIPTSAADARSLLRVERASPTPTCRGTRCPASAPLVASPPISTSSPRAGGGSSRVRDPSSPTCTSPSRRPRRVPCRRPERGRLGGLHQAETASQTTGPGSEPSAE